MTELASEIAYEDSVPRSTAPRENETPLPPELEAAAGTLVDVEAGRIGSRPPTGTKRESALRWARSQILRAIAEETPKTPGATRFTTDYAAAHGRAQGWRLVDRERYDARLRRHHDLELGADVKFETEVDFVFVQGAGVGERAEHRRRFEERGGAARARKQNARFLYVEFVRGAKAPVRLEWWA